MAERAQVSAKKPEAKRENKASLIQKTGPSQSISSPVEQILFLQRTVGNQAVGRLIKSGVLQAKLRIGQPGDIYEQEADRVAEQVMRMPEPNISKETKVYDHTQNNPIQRRCPGCIKGTQPNKEEGEKMVGRDIAFNHGQYLPETDQGKKLLGHELTHFVQQNHTTTHLIQRQTATIEDQNMRQFRRNLDINKFFNDLNQSTRTVSGKESKLSMNDFKLYKPEEFIEQKPIKTLKSYSSAKQQAEEICTLTNESMREICKEQKDVNACIADSTNFQKNECRNGKPSKSLIARAITTLGLTTTLAEPSLVMMGAENNQTLETIIHEGIHRLRGNTWSNRSKIGRFFHTRTREMLAHIREKLDEGTVQIITIAVKEDMKKKNWFKNYSSDFYNDEIQFVKKILGDHGKDIDFLKNAYFGDNTDENVQDLQSWQ